MRITQIMNSKRQNKISRLLLKELADIFQKEFFQNALISVTVVRISPDLSYARVYLSISGLSAVKLPEEEKKSLFDNITAHKKRIRKLLGNRIRHQLRSIPQLEFFVDDSIDYEENIDRLLSNL